MSRTDGKGRFGRKRWIVVGLALTIPAAVAARYAGQHLARRRIERNESAAIAALRAYLSAQNQFKREDFYGIGEKSSNGQYVYANPQHGTGFPDLYQVGYGTEDAGKVLEYIDVSFARATPDGVPKDGYYFSDLVGVGGQATWWPYDYSIDCGLSATPVGYGVTGRKIFIIDVTGTIYQIDAKRLYPDLEDGDAVPPLRTYPTDGRPSEYIPRHPHD